MSLPLAFCRQKNKPSKLKILKSKEEKMNREKGKKKTNQPKKPHLKTKYRRTSNYHHAVKTL